MKKNEVKVFQANELLEAQKESESIDELRLFYIGLRDLVPKLNENQEQYDKEFPLTFLPAPTVVNMFGGNGAYYTKLETVCEAQTKRIVRLKEADGSFSKIPVYARIDFLKGQGLYIRFNNEMKPFLLDLINSRKGFTEIDFEEIFALSSTYSWKLLELIKQWVKRKNEMTIEIEEFRNRMGVPAFAYKKIKDFKKKVLDGPISEINKKTVFLLGYETIKTGRRISHIKITWNLKENNSLEKENNKEIGGIAPLTPEQQKVYDKLVAYPWKVTIKRANNVVRKYSISYIMAQVRYCDVQKIDRNPGGFLYKSIEGNWANYQEKEKITVSLEQSPQVIGITEEKLPAVSIDPYSPLPEIVVRMIKSNPESGNRGHVKQELEVRGLTVSEVLNGKIQQSKKEKTLTVEKSEIGYAPDENPIKKENANVDSSMDEATLAKGNQGLNEVLPEGVPEKNNSSDESDNYESKPDKKIYNELMLKRLMRLEAEGKLTDEQSKKLDDLVLSLI